MPRRGFPMPASDSRPLPSTLLLLDPRNHILACREDGKRRLVERPPTRVLLEADERRIDLFQVADVAQRQTLLAAKEPLTKPHQSLRRPRRERGEGNRLNNTRHAIRLLSSFTNDKHLEPKRPPIFSRQPEAAPHDTRHMSSFPAAIPHAFIDTPEDCTLVIALRIEGGYVPLELVLGDGWAVWVLGWGRWPADVGEA